MDDNSIDLETAYDIYPSLWAENIAYQYTLEEFIAALEAMTTLTHLSICFDDYEPTRENNRRVVEPLCRCISNLRLHNAQHPLRKLSLEHVHVFDENKLVEGVFAQFLVAAKQFGIYHTEFCLNYLPIQALVEFCRDNKSLKVLELQNVSLRCTALPLNNGPPNDSVILTLDKLRLDCFVENSTAAAAFAYLVAHVNVSCLWLVSITSHIEEGEDDNDTQITERILSELKMPSAEQLTLDPICRMDHFKSALDAGTTSVTDLNVRITEFNEATARLDLLASFICRAVKLNSLTLSHFSYGHQSCPPPSSPPLHFFQAMEACATATQIQVTGFSLSPNEEQQLQKIASRNLELDRFATNPGTYTIEELPELMRQFDNCPTGRYMLARRFPEVLSFAELYAMHLSRRRTNPPTPKKSKLR